MGETVNKTGKLCKKKWYRINMKTIKSIMVIGVLLFSGIVLILPEDSQSILNTRGLKELSQASSSDFDNGTKDNVIIVGSGQNAVLKLDKTLPGWSVDETRVKPSLREAHAMAPVFGTDNVVLYGGSDGGNETWVYDSSDSRWIQKNQTINPWFTRYPELANIWGTGEVLLFGGTLGNTTYPYRNDTWVYTLKNNSWVEKKPPTSPSKRVGHKIAPVWNTDKVVLYGGTAGGNKYLDETWVYDYSDNNWERKLPVNNPGAKGGHAMATIFGTDKIVLFGGDFVDNTTWIYDLSENNWKKINTKSAPNARSLHAMTPIYGTDTVLLFGGIYDSKKEFTVINDTWIFDYSESKWTKQKPKNYPEGRQNTAMAPVYGTSRIVLFGGYSYFDDKTWIYDDSMNGKYISPPIDLGNKMDFENLLWHCGEPEGTDIKIQLRTAGNEAGLAGKKFLGPDGSVNGYYKSSPAGIWPGHDGDRWIQYTVYFSTSITDVTPVFNNITFSFLSMPTVDLGKPSNNIVLSNNKPLFTWEITYPDFVQQSGFQVQIDDEPDFISVDFDSGLQTGTELSWNFLVNNTYNCIPDGSWYWRVRIQDGEDAWGDFCEPWKFTVDTTPPGSNIEFPVNSGSYLKVESIFGNALDVRDVSEVALVEVVIKRNEDDFCWEGSSWSQTETWLTAKGTNEWVYETGTIKWTSGSSYTVQTMAADSIGNKETVTAGITFSIDHDKPQSVILHPSDISFLSSLNEINGGSDDGQGSGVSLVEISIKRINDNHFWNGSQWMITEQWLEANGTASWHYDTIGIPWVSNNRYQIRSRAVDSLGHKEVPGNGVSFLYDALPPESLTIIINDNEDYTNSSRVHLSLEAYDFGAGVFEMSFSSDGKVWTAWEPFSQFIYHDIGPVDGTKKINLRVKDRAGNIAGPVYDSIILDSKPPENISIIINNGSDETSSVEVLLKLVASDNISGVHLVSFSSDNITWEPWEIFMEEMYYKLSPGEGIKNIYLKVTDKVGNVADVVTASIILIKNDPVIRESNPVVEVDLPEPDLPVPDSQVENDNEPEKNLEQNEEQKDEIKSNHLLKYFMVIALIVVVLIILIRFKSRIISSG